MAGDSQSPDDALLRAAQAGDQEAFRTLFDRNVATLRSYIREWLPQRLRRKVSVSDVLQETRIAALRRCLDFEHRGDRSFRNWLLRIVEYKVKEAVRHYAGTAKRSVECEVSRGYRADTGHFVGQQASPSEMAIASELKELAQQAFRALPENHREVLRLAREERLSLREIAERCGRSRESVKKIYARAVARFAREFDRLQGRGHG